MLSLFWKPCLHPILRHFYIIILEALPSNHRYQWYFVFLKMWKPCLHLRNPWNLVLNPISFKTREMLFNCYGSHASTSNSGIFFVVKQHFFKFTKKILNVRVSDVSRVGMTISLYTPASWAVTFSITSSRVM